jgi:hypothetical protein
MSRAAAWAEHLRGGGTTPWSAFAATTPDDGPAPADAADVPGAQQLEALRRLNQAGRPSPARVERVLSADLVGRGRGDLGLVGEPHPRFGTPPVDPADLPVKELLRVLTGLLAEDVVRAGVPRRAAPRRPRFRRVRYQLSGDPWLAVPMREELTRRGYPPGGGQAVTYLVGRDLPTMIVDAWTRRALVDGVAGWETWLRKLRRADRLPARADLTRQARWWAKQVGAENVRIVTDPALVPEILDVDIPLPTPPVLAADALDLARRVSPVVGLFAGPGKREELMRRGLVPRLAGVAGPPLAVPERFHRWVARRAQALHEELSSGHYAVLGDPALVLGAPPAGASPSEPAVLALALRTLLENDPASRVAPRVEGA